jgi:hypothetical protein
MDTSQSALPIDGEEDVHIDVTGAAGAPESGVDTVNPLLDIKEPVSHAPDAGLDAPNYPDPDKIGVLPLLLV